MHHSEIKADVRKLIADGTMLPAHPLALDANRKLDTRHQRALTRYYLDAGAGGLAVGVHTTQFAIRDVGMYRPVLELAAQTAADWTRQPLAMVAGLAGPTQQATAEAQIARGIGYHAGLLSLAAMADADDAALAAHCAAVGARIPLIGFYLQSSVGGRPLSYTFWRRFAEIPAVVAIKIAPFNRYQTLDVVRAVVDAGRGDIALYTGNDDAIVADLVTPFRFAVGGRPVERRIVGGLLGHWAVWTRGAVSLLGECQAAARAGHIPTPLLQRGIEVTDANAAFFDAAHGFAGCIAGIQEVLRRQGLVRSTRCLSAHDVLSPGQAADIDRVCGAYPHLADDDFVRAHLDEWLRC